MTSRRTSGTAAALTVTLGLAAVSWVVTVRWMHGTMDRASRRGSDALSGDRAGRERVRHRCRLPPAVPQPRAAA
ncbi:hypothetical protein, partial [Streptomyces albicerus]|uniref:hypothetical protein n=1 Tax=Streptomyces albicerus TaxID=2569859 RepID=UPI001CEC9A3A